MVQKKLMIGARECIHERFDGINEFLTVLESRPISEAYVNDSTAHLVRSDNFNDGYKNSSWYGARSYNDAREAFIYGTKAKKAAQKAYAATQISRERETIGAPCGGAPIVANALRGLPCSMLDTRRKRQPRTVRVVVNMSISYRTTAAQITEAGKAIIAAVGKLDAQGIQTEIICTADKILKGTQISSCGITIKDAGQAFNASRVSFSMSSPAFLRVFQFAHLSSRQDGALYDYSYGSCIAYCMTDEERRDFYARVYGECINFTLADVVLYGAAAIDKAIKAWRG